MTNIMNLCSILVTFLLFGIEQSVCFQESGKSKGACGGIFTEDEFYLQSPGYPENYAPNLECDYWLRGPECSAFYQLNFVDFNLENSVGCTKDRLEIEDQDAVCGKEHRVKRYLSLNGSLHLKLKTDRDFSDKGFNISITRLDCEVEPRKNEYTTTENIETSTIPLTSDSTTPFFQYFNIPNSKLNPTQCCMNTFISKRFILTSPNFPYSLDKKTECTIRIQKANNNVCRMRLNFLFFWLGSTNLNSCPYGFLKIDGKFICGCNKELKLTTTFGDSDVKTLIFESEGIKLDSQSGFVVEVIQDDCPKKYYPETPSGDRSQDVRLYNDPRSMEGAVVEKLQLVDERTNVLEDKSNLFYRSNPKVIKSFYFFAAPDYIAIPSAPHDIERTTFIDTESINSVVTNFNQNECNYWNQIQLNLLNERYGKNLQTCTQNQESNEQNSTGENDCVELDYINGYFKSPGYPFYYPGRLNMCYRFRKQPGYCAIRMYMADFQIENSFKCKKDYLLLNNNRHCGNDLFGWTLMFDLTNKNHEDIRFVTDFYRCGRGFSGIYQQIACQQPSYPINPITSTIPPITTPSTRSPICDRFVQEKSFRFEIFGDQKMCAITVRKFSHNVCKIDLYFEKFDLDCDVESLIVDGMIFCGHLSGRKVSVNMEGGKAKQLIYRSGSRNWNRNLKIRIIGEQITEDCLFPEVPLQRLVQLEPSFFPNSVERRMDNETSGHSTNYFISMRNENLKEICGIVSKSALRDIPENFCDILKKLHNANSCVILNKDYSYVPYKTNIMKLNNADIPIIEVEYEETDCDYLK